MRGREEAKRKRAGQAKGGSGAAEQAGAGKRRAARGEARAEPAAGGRVRKEAERKRAGQAKGNRGVLERAAPGKRRAAAAQQHCPHSLLVEDVVEKSSKKRHQILQR